jgi:hypothetical protein
MHVAACSFAHAGAVFLDGVSDVSIEDCVFRDLGGNGLFISNYARRGLLLTSLDDTCCTPRHMSGTCMANA